MRNSISVILAIFLLGSVSLLFVARNANNNLDRDLITTRSKSDSLTKENESLNKTVNEFKDQRDSLSATTKDLERSLIQTNARLTSEEKEISRAQNTAEENSKKNTELLATQKDLEKQLNNLKTVNDQLGQENNNLTSKVASLSDASKHLNDQLELARTTAKDNILIETMTKSGQLNLKGKKVRKIVASLSVLGEMKSPTFRLFDPNGVQLPEQNGSFDLKSINETSANSSSGNSMKIELTYLLSKKIGPGLYKIEMLNENRHVGNLLVRFR